MIDLIDPITPIKPRMTPDQCWQATMTAIVLAFVVLLCFCWEEVEKMQAGTANACIAQRMTWTGKECIK